MKQIVLFVLLVLPVSSSYSEIYKWVDENGNIQFSDKAPEDQGAQTKTIQIKDKRNNNAKSTSIKDVVLEDVPAYTGSQPTRSVFLERVVVDPDVASLGKSVKVGKAYSPKLSSTIGINQLDPLLGCVELADIYIESVDRLIAGSPLPKHFYRRFEKYGYATASNSDVLFAAQDKNRGDISIAAVIKEVWFETC